MEHIAVRFVDALWWVEGIKDQSTTRAYARTIFKEVKSHADHKGDRLAEHPEVAFLDVVGSLDRACEDLQVLGRRM